MRHVCVFPAHGGGWIYWVSYGNSPSVLGWKPTKEEAEHEARLAG